MILLEARYHVLGRRYGTVVDDDDLEEPRIILPENLGQKYAEILGIILRIYYNRN